MPQETNLNVSPYFDDFDPNKDYHKVLFKPGYPIQARELTTLQSILQNQIEKFGQHFFKEGSKVIPGNIAYNNSYYAVELNNEYLGINLSSYLSQLIDRKITGRTSGVSAVVKGVLRANESERGNVTLYVSYISSSTVDNSSTIFSDGELLTLDQTVSFGGKIISAGEPFASTISLNTNSVASAFSITNGVYFAKGQFVSVEDETIILDQYGNTPSYRIGLLLREEIINSDIDPTLNDNSRGFSNFSAPGADRLKITARLHKKNLDDFENDNFVELAVINNGILRTLSKNNNLEGFQAELAKRTYDESGDYYVSPFSVSIKESLNDNLGNNGVFSSNQITDSGSVPSENLALYQVSPGKALVRGYPIETLSPTYLDVPKTRNVKFLNNQLINYYTGPTLSLNRVYGNPKIGIGNTFVLSLRNERVGFAVSYGSLEAPATHESGKEIGLARVYDYRLDSGQYDADNLNRNRWAISLYDIQPFTEITLNEPITLLVPTFVKGKYSGATAFLRNSVNNEKTLTLYQKNGEFINNESFIFDGIENNRIAIAVTSYSISDVKSVFGLVSAGSTFSADVVQSDSLVIGLSTISASKYNSNINFINPTLTENVGISSTTIYLSNTSNVSIGDSISIGIAYTNARIVAVGTTFVQISSASTTPGTSLTTTLTSDIGVGSTVIFVGFTTGVSIGSSVSVGSAVTSVQVVGVGTTFIQISTASTSPGITLNTSIGQAVSFGSTVIFVDDTTGITTSSRISVAGVGTTSALNNIEVTGVGGNFVTIGFANTSYPGTSVGLTTTLTANVGSGTTEIFVGILTGRGISIGSSFSVGSGAAKLVNVGVVGLGTTSIFISSADAPISTISAGTAVTFRNVSSLIVGSAVTFTNVSNMISGTAVTFTRVSDALSGDDASISYILNTSTVISNSPAFNPINFKPFNIVKYTDTTLPNPVLARVVSANASSIEIASVRTVAGITSSVLPSNTIQVLDLTLQNTNLQSSSDNSLYTPLPKRDIASVDLTDATLSIRKVDTVNIVGNKLGSTLLAGTNEIFLPFDEERYSLVRSNGVSEVLTRDRIEISGNGKQLQILNLGPDDTNATLITTRRKSNVVSKVKYKNRVNSIIVDKSKLVGSGIGSTTLNDGLTYGNYPYGTRVQDETISLNYPDVINVLAIYESLDQNDPTAPLMTLSALNGPSQKTDDLIVGEKIIGQTSGAVAIVSKLTSDYQIEYIVRNQGNFIVGESVTFEESQVFGTILSTSTTSSDISFNYSFQTGQNETFYNYGTIKRKSESQEPSRKIKIYFSSTYYDSSDTGDVTTKESYNTLDYITDIKSVNDIRNTDIIDIRPRVSQYTVSENSRSPLEFLGRVFDASGNSAANILASDENIETTFSYYLGRIDRIFLSKTGEFQVLYGASAETPELPPSIDDSLEIAQITLPPYLYNIKQASVSFLDYKRYRMVDINQLENRIKNLEYYTSLSLLETNTANLFVPDNNGLNRFKSGFYVDNFTNTLTQEPGVVNKNSIDVRNKEIRPSHYTTSIDLTLGPVENINQNSDASFREPEGSNIRRSGDVITLDYDEVVWLNQYFATRSESVTPYLVSYWNGTIELTPSSDTWVVPNRIESNIQQVEGNYSETLARATREFNVDPNTGFSPTIWGAWTTNWTGETITNNTVTRNVTGNTVNTRVLSTNGNTRTWETNTTTTVFEDTTTQIRQFGVESRSGTRTQFTEFFDRVSSGDRVTDRSAITIMRSRNVQFVSSRLLPNSRIYAFFDGVDVTKYCTPKLIEISMVSGTFQVGEDVVGEIDINGTGVANSASRAQIRFRVAKSNHKLGPYDTPSRTYTVNPYVEGGQLIPENYSSTSTILNVDTASLANMGDNPEYRGYIEQGMRLIGTTSGAEATISNVRLISDDSSFLIGSFFVPDPNVPSNPKFETGNKSFTLINSSINSVGESQTSASETFISSGTLETIQENIISIRNARIETINVSPESRNVNRLVSSQTTTQQVSTNVQTGTNIEVLPPPSPPPSPAPRSQDTRTWLQVQQDWAREVQRRDAERAAFLASLPPRPDPLSQSFLVDDSSGVFLTKCDVFFETKDDMGVPVTLQIRTMENGYPTTRILPFSEVDLSPDQVNISSDGSVPTSFSFSAPVYLEGGIEYAICVLSLSTKYKAFISRVGENDLLTQSFVSQQPFLGSLFKSQNASTWEPSQWEDLKFTLYRADFATDGFVEFYNPVLSLGNDQIATLMPNSLSLSSNRIRVGLGSTLQDPFIQFGNTIVQSNSNASGNYVGNSGIATGNLNIINAGIGYTPALGFGSKTYIDVNLVNVTGSGSNAKANITISNGVAIAATVSSSGFGHQVGDVFTVNTVGINSVGRDMRLSLVSIANTNTIILDNVQGEFKTIGAGNTVEYINNSGIRTALNGTSGGGVAINEITTISDGLHIKVNHKNHGMYFENNLVKISNVIPDILPTTLASEYSSTSTSPISVVDSSSFGIFENVGVGTTNKGYLLIGNEVISYTETSSGFVGGQIERSVGSLTGNISTSRTYPAGTPVYKYELSGVSLNRINTIHDLRRSTVPESITFDSYTINVDMGANGIGRTDGFSFPKLFINQTKSAGGNNIKATQNIPYEVITPQLHNMTLSGTSVRASVRTVTSQSIDGNEIPYIDAGFQAISLNSVNYLTSPRAIYSRLNETNNLINTPGNKSFNMRVLMNSSDSRITPVIDAQRANIILTSNRINKPIENYITDNRVNSISDDPHAFQYVSKEITLENPATSLKVLLNAHINLFSDIRIFYAVSESSGFTPIFRPFIGYENLSLETYDVANSTGHPDFYIQPSSRLGFVSETLDFSEYTFTIDQLAPFRSYRIKIVMTSTNQVYVPRIKELRTIALA
jgi:hypothetical protein